jgi:hypothetical protein
MDFLFQDIHQLLLDCIHRLRCPAKAVSPAQNKREFVHLFFQSPQNVLARGDIAKSRTYKTTALMRRGHCVDGSKRQTKSSIALNLSDILS